MNISILDSWLREYLDTRATPEKIAECLSLCGPSVEKIERIDNDIIYHIEVTTNRVDMMSVLGITREAAAILPQFGINATYKGIKLENVEAASIKKLPIEIQDPHHLCYRIIGVVLEGVNLGPSPRKISQRLQAAGIRSLNNAIDITNYVMTEVGHPTHVFDYDRIKTHKLILREAKSGESLVSLEKKKYLLQGGEVVIDDGTGEIIDLPGIIGTGNSVVTNKTQQVFFFMEANNPVKIRQASMKHGIRTVAATLNEKGVDPELGKTALLRGIQLFKEITGAKLASEIIDVYPQPYKPKKVAVSLQLIKQYLGTPIQLIKVKKILESLGFKTVTENRQSPAVTVTIPSWRANDISIPEDLIEEIARIYGYHNLPSILPAGKLPQKPTNQTFNLESIAQNTLADWGYTETYTYSMQSEAQIKNCNLILDKHLKISNPLSEEWFYMRRSLVPSVLSVIAENQGYRGDIKIFELANVYLEKENQLPREKLNLVICQSGKPRTNYMVRGKNQYYQLKGIMEVLLKKLGIKNYKIKPLNRSPIFNSNKTAEITIDGKLLGQLGEINSQILNRFLIKPPVFCLALDFEVVSQFSDRNKSFTPLPMYPPIIEDLTFVLKPKTYLQNLIQLIKKCSLPHRLPGERKVSRRPRCDIGVAQPRRKPLKRVSFIESVELVDSYKNNRTLRITYQHPQRNLTDKEVKKIREKIIKRVETDPRAKLKS